MESFLLDKSISSVAQSIPEHCQFVTELSGGYAYAETCIYLRRGSISNVHTNLSAPFSLEDANLLLIEMEMTNCSGGLAGCSYCCGGSVDFTLSTVSQCSGSLAGVSASVDALVTIETCQFTECSISAIFVDGGSLNVSYFRLNDNLTASGCLIRVNSSLWTRFSFMNISAFDNVTGIEIRETPKTVIQSSRFVGFSNTVLSFGSGCYAVVRECCFANEANPIVAYDSLSVMIEEVVNSSDCLFLSTSTTEISEHVEEFGIITCVVFFIFFGFVWIGMIIFVVVKIGNYAVVKYAFLHQEEEEDYDDMESG